MKPQYLQEIKQHLEIIQSRYYKQMYVYDYKYGDSVKVFSEQENYPYLNISLELSEKLVEIDPTKRKYYVTEYLQEIILKRESNVVCIDYIELLFHPQLAIDPFHLLEDISKNKVLITCWRGKIEGNTLIHAEPGHPEYKKQKVTESFIIQ